MALKIHKPVTSGRRHSSVIDYSLVLTKGAKPVRKLLVLKKKHGGRNSTGKITVRHRGGGSKQFIRIVDWKQQQYDIPGSVVALEYDPIRTAFLARLSYPDGSLSYIIAPQGISVGDTIVSSLSRQEIKPGNRFPLSQIPTGTDIYNIELTPGKGGQIVRSAGSAAVLMAVEGAFAQVKMPSGEIRIIPKEASASIGRVSNPDNIHERVGKAGRSRRMGIRPSVRGKAMNPVDHPHGGGEGKHPIGLTHPKTPWGKHALGVKTRKIHKQSNAFIIKRR